ncbi:MAG: YraN family protein [Eggerthellaceae bacterium]|nr:YraN family protein [Eggerthellaceae bacterium]
MAEDKEAKECCEEELGEELAARGVHAAARYLEMMDLEILEKGWQCPAGEVDIIARDGNAVVFVEVKVRTSLVKGLPSEFISEEKRSRFEKIAGFYLRDYEFVDVPVHFDVVSLLIVSKDRALVRHYRNAFAGAC